MSYKFINLAFASIIWLCSTIANAGLIINEEGLENLDWFDLSLTEGLSRREVESLIASSSEFEGYRYATHNEAHLLFDTIFNSIGYTDSHELNTDIILNNSELGIDLIDDYESFFRISTDNISSHVELGFSPETGWTKTRFYHARNIMYYGDIIKSGPHLSYDYTKTLSLDIFHGTEPLHPVSVALDWARNIIPSGINFKGRYEVTTSLLVKNVELGGTPRAVPEPTTFAMFVLGMIGLASRRFKKEYKKF